MDTAIVDALLLTVRDGRLGIVDDGAVAFADGEITYAGPAADLDETAADTVVDGSGCAVLPGLVDAHAHTGLTLLRGGAQDLPEAEWMDRGLGPLAAHADPEDRVAGCRLGVLEAVRAGATTVCEYAAGVDRLVEAVYDPLGVRTVAVETINEVPEDRSDGDPDEPYPFDRGRGEAALERAEALFDRRGDDRLVTPAYGPQALDMVSLDRLREIRDRAAARGGEIHMHVAQGGRERRQIEARYGADASTVGVLDDHDVPSGRLVAVHCHGATGEERALLAERGARMVGCPGSIAAIDGVVPPVVEYREHGGTVGLGTDQAPGPGGHDMFRELRTAALLAKTDRGDPTTLPAWRALRLGTVGGARALGIDDRVGTLEAGKRADVAVVDLGDLGVAPAVREPFHTAVPNLVYGAGGAVRDVFVDGEPVFRGGSFVDADPDAAVAKARERAERVFGEAAADWRAAGSALVEAVDDGWL